MGLGSLRWASGFARPGFPLPPLILCLMPSRGMPVCSYACMHGGCNLSELAQSERRQRGTRAPRSCTRTNSSSSHYTACTITAASASSRRQARPRTAAIRAPILCSLKLDEVPASVGGMEGGGGMGAGMGAPALEACRCGGPKSQTARLRPRHRPHPLFAHPLLATCCWLLAAGCTTCCRPHPLLAHMCSTPPRHCQLAASGAEEGGMPPTVGHLFRQGREAGVHQVHNILHVSGGWVVVPLAVHTHSCMPAARAGGHAGGPRSMRLTQEVRVDGDPHAGWQGLAGASSTIELEPWW